MSCVECGYPRVLPEEQICDDCAYLKVILPPILPVQEILTLRRRIEVTVGENRTDEISLFYNRYNKHIMWPQLLTIQVGMLDTGRPYGVHHFEGEDDRYWPYKVVSNRKGLDGHIRCGQAMSKDKCHIAIEHYKQSGASGFDVFMSSWAFVYDHSNEMSKHVRYDK